MTGYKGFFYHFLDMKTGERFEDSELSTVDTALLLAGVLFCQSYFDGAHPEEARSARSPTRSTAASTGSGHRRARRRSAWAGRRRTASSPTTGAATTRRCWSTSSRSARRRIRSAEAWGQWTSTYDQSWGTVFGQEHLDFAPLFGHQYSHVWIDFRGIQDAYMRRRGIDYFENSRRAVYAQRAYAIANPLGCKATARRSGASPPATARRHRDRRHAGQARRSAPTRRAASADAAAHDDGTLAPTAAVASIPFAPEIAIPAVLDMHAATASTSTRKYGFLDAFNPSFTFTDVTLQPRPLRPGRRLGRHDYLGIDQGR